MKIGVQGLWHLGLVTCAGLIKMGYEIVAVDFDPKLILELNRGYLPINEPGITEIIQKAVISKQIIFTSDPELLKSCEIFWLTYDTPVNSDDIADEDYVFDQLEKSLNFLNPNCVFLISSQLSVGSAKKIQIKINNVLKNNRVTLVVIPENLRLGTSLQTFLQADRIIVGIDSEDNNFILNNFLELLKIPVIKMKIESAEMLKHALNSYLALSITFIHEISEICEDVGAIAHEVEKGLKSDSRIGYNAYLTPGLGFAGGTLARDVNYLIKKQNRARNSSIIATIIPSNLINNNWVYKKIKEAFTDLSGVSLHFIGLTYKSGTDTLRRSEMLSFGQKVSSEVKEIAYFDNEMVELKSEMGRNFRKMDSICDINEGKNVVIIGKQMDVFDDIRQIRIMFSKASLILDPSGILFEKVKSNQNLMKYLRVGNFYE
jgi:UDPglucose 6-dehydrogenase